MVVIIEDDNQRANMFFNTCVYVHNDKIINNIIEILNNILGWIKDHLYDEKVIIFKRQIRFNDSTNLEKVSETVVL